MHCADKRSYVLGDFKAERFQVIEAVADIIDKLSKGISLISEGERRTLEFLCFIRNVQKREAYQASGMVWTTLARNVLYPILHQPDNLELEKSFFDSLWEMSFLDIITVLEKNKHHEPFVFRDIVEFLNEAKEKYKDQNKYFEEMFLSE